MARRLCDEFGEVQLPTVGVYSDYDQLMRMYIGLGAEQIAKPAEDFKQLALWAWWAEYRMLCMNYMAAKQLGGHDGKSV